MSMADIFYFSSPRTPTQLAKCPSSFRNRPEIARKRRTTPNSMYAPTARVVRHTEPTFCANGPTALSLAGCLLHDATTRLDTSTRFDLHGEHADPDDEDEPDGGVALPDRSHDFAYHDFDDTHMSDAHLQTSYDILDLNLHYHTQQYDTGARLAAHDRQSTERADHSALPREHPRPESREIWEEEDGRRLRLALDGDCLYRAPQSAEAINVTPRTDFSTFTLSVTGLVSHPVNPTTYMATTTPISISSGVVSSYEVVPQRRDQTLPTRNASIGSTTHADPRSPISISSHDEMMDLDDDAMAVDDPRRNYDFAEFLDTWRLRSVYDKCLPPFAPDLLSSVRLDRAGDIVTNHRIKSGHTDIQGLHWRPLGPTRQQASSARAILHPARCSRHCATNLIQDRTAEEETSYSFRSFVTKHQAKFNHYQLRNVLTASNRHQVFYATGSQVKATSLACPDADRTVMDLSSPGHCTAGFRITCLSASRKASNSSDPGALIAGGFCGEWAILGLGTKSATSAQGFVTNAYNGLVTHIHNFPARRSGLLKAVFCSNDCKTRIMDIRRLQFTDTFCYDHAINGASTSADGRLRVLVGDSKETLITDAERGHTLVTLKQHTDHAFACDWSPDGRHVATGAQDGNVLIWDARNWSTPLSSLQSAMTCARSLNFTETGTLVAAENDDIVRIYNSKLYDTWQDIRFFGSIAGVELLDGGAELAIANADKTVGGLLTFTRNPLMSGCDMDSRHVCNAEASRSRSRRSGLAQQGNDLVDGLTV